MLPTFTTSYPGPEFSPGQLVFHAAVASLVLYLLFVFSPNRPTGIVTFSLPVAQKRPESARIPKTTATPSRRAPARHRLTSLALLLVALLAVVGLAEEESPPIERLVSAAGFPHSFVGVVIAALVLLPETLAAVRAARQGRIQTSLNLAYGSALASIGLTIPAIALASVWVKGPLVLGLGPLQLALLALTVVISVLTVVPGRATRLQG